MIPGVGGINPKQMAAMMRQMGIKTTEIDAEKVVVFKADGSQLVVSPASVQLIEMQGTKQLQVAGSFSDGESSGKSNDESTADDDAKMVAQQASVSLEKAKEALAKSNGDIAEAIMLLENAK